MERFADVALASHADKMLEHADVHGGRVIEDERWKELFGIDNIIR